MNYRMVLSEIKEYRTLHPAMGTNMGFYMGDMGGSYSAANRALSEALKQTRK